MGARTLTAQQLEAGDTTIEGQLGAGVGKWRLTVSSDRPIQVVNLVAATAGYLNNLSTTAVPGAAPGDLAALNDRFVGVDVVYETASGRFTLNAMAGERFTETGEVDGVSTSFAGGYGYAGIGPDSGWLTLDYDDGDECQANFYFSTRTAGWFASQCTGADDPDGYWLGGNWFVEDPDDSSPVFAAMSGPGDRTYTAGTAIETLTLPEATGGDGVLTYGLSPDVPGLSFESTTRQLTGTPSTAGGYAMTYAATDEDGDTATLEFSITVSGDSSGTGTGGDCHVGLLVSMGESCTYPGTTDEFTVNERGRGRFLTFLAGIRIRVNNQTIDERVYDFEASHQGDGVWRIDRIAGSTEPPTADASPGFGTASGPGDRTYTVGIAIAALTLPAATGGDGDLTYSLSPDVPGLSFDGATRQLTGTPSTAGTYGMTYAATDSDGDADSRTFTVTVMPAPTVALGDCHAGLTVGTGESCTYAGTDAAFTVDEQGRGSFLSSQSDMAIGIDNRMIDGRVYDLAASHQGDGDWRIDRIAGSTERPTGGGDTGTGQELYRGVRVAPENRCSDYESDDYSYLQSVEEQIVAGIGKIYSPVHRRVFRHDAGHRYRAYRRPLGGPRQRHVRGERRHEACVRAGRAQPDARQPVREPFSEERQGRGRMAAEPERLLVRGAHARGAAQVRPDHRPGRSRRGRTDPFHVRLDGNDRARLRNVNGTARGTCNVGRQRRWPHHLRGSPGSRHRARAPGASGLPVHG